MRTYVGKIYAVDFDKIQPDRTRITSYVLRASDAENDMFKWIECLVMKNLPLSMIDCPLTRAAIRFKPVTSKSLRKHILSLCSTMKEDIKAKIPERFAVIFDGWTEGTRHYIGVFVSYAALPAGGAKEGGRDVVTQTLQSMRPLLTGEVNGMFAQDHLLHLSQVLQTYGKSDENILCLIGDNCSVNKRMARILRVPLIGCGSHKFNLAVTKWISNQPQLEGIIQKVASVMKRASTLKVSAQLLKLTTLHTVQENDTRWSSTFEMVARFFRIQTELSAVPDLFPLLPSLLECALLKKAFVHFTHFSHVTVMLQKEGITLVRVRKIFDSVMVDYPELAGHLAPDAPIVVNPVFERAVIHISRGMSLSVEERESVSMLLSAPLSVPTPDNFNSGTSGSAGAQEEVEVSYAQKLEARMKRRKTSTDVIVSQFINLDILCGTSVSCERLFSAAKHILTDTRKSTSLAVFESILLLKVNRKEWDDVTSFGRAMGQTTRMSFGVGASVVGAASSEIIDIDNDLFYD